MDQDPILEILIEYPVVLTPTDYSIVKALVPLVYLPKCVYILPSIVFHINHRSVPFSSIKNYMIIQSSFLHIVLTVLIRCIYDLSRVIIQKSLMSQLSQLGQYLISVLHGQNHGIWLVMIFFT